MTENQSPDPRADRELVASFVLDGSEEAFGEMVRRHGPLVMSVCRRTLSQHHDAEDAFQATFMVLARNAGKIKRREALASWLYGVAFRVSARQRRRKARQTTDLIEDQLMTADDPFEKLRVRYEQGVTDGELSKLPENLRAPMVLRYLTGKTNEEIARQLDLTVAAVEGRLKRAKARLRLQLAKHGVGLSVALLAMNITKGARAEIAAPLLEKTVLAGLQSLESVPIDQSLDDRGSSWLAEEEMMAMSGSKMTQFVGAIVLCGCVVTAGLGIHGALQASHRNAVPQNDTSTAAAQPFSTVGASSAQSQEFPIRIAQTRARRSSGEVRRVQVENPSDSRKRSQRGIYSPSDQKIIDALSTRRDFDFLDTPLTDVTRELSDVLGIPVLIDTRELEDVGIVASETPISFDLNANITAASALKHMLYSKQLSYAIRDEVLVITTWEGAEAQLQTIVYRTSDLSSDLENLIKLIVTMIEPDSWSEVGGEGAIGSYGGTLVISATRAVHEKIESLLDRLAKAK